jgi:hypothetical protein
MPLNKHKIFKIAISDDGKFTFEQKVQNEINSFLAVANNIYINHSISIISEDSEEYGDSKTVNKFIVVSLVYKDLADSPVDLEKASPVVRKIVNTSYTEDGEIIAEPIIQSDFEKEIKHLLPA